MLEGSSSGKAGSIKAQGKVVLLYFLFSCMCANGVERGDMLCEFGLLDRIDLFPAQFHPQCFQGLFFQFDIIAQIPQEW